MEKPHHVIIDLYDCIPHLLCNKFVIATWLDNCIKLTGMTAVGQPVFEQFQGKHPLDNGITCAQTLAESLISIHTYPRERAVYIDVFSCQPFATDNLYTYCKMLFKGKGYCQTIERMSIKK